MGSRRKSYSIAVHIANAAEEIIDKREREKTLCDFCVVGRLLDLYTKACLVAGATGEFLWTKKYK